MKKQILLVITLLICVITLDAQWKQLPALKNLRIYYLVANDNIILANAESVKEVSRSTMYTKNIIIHKHIEHKDNLYFSTNTGKSWNNIPDILLDATQIRGFVIVKKTIVIATSSFGILVSNDSLKSVNESNSGLPFRSIRSICKTKDRIYVSSSDNRSIYVSDDECKSWSKCSKIQETNTFEFNSLLNLEKIMINKKFRDNEFYIYTGYNDSWKVEKDLFSSETLYKFIMRNSECSIGLPFDNINTSDNAKLPKHNSLLFKNESIYAATINGLFVTKNLQSWIEIPTTNLQNKNITAVTFSNDAIYIAINNDGIFKMEINNIAIK